RGCWKLFQDTPTVQPAPVAPLPPPPAAVDGVALLEKAANTTAAVPTTAASLLICILTPPRTGIVEVTVCPAAGYILGIPLSLRPHRRLDSQRWSPVAPQALASSSWGRSRQPAPASLRTR